eukprot:3146123-Ditylum_brightwellii.AAC.1
MSNTERFNANPPLMRHVRSYPAAAAVGQYIYITGGRDAGGYEPSTAECPQSTAEFYDIDTQQWNEIKSMSTKRHGHAA